MKIAIVVDSASGVTKKQADALGWYYLPLTIYLDEKTYKDGVDVDATNIYQHFDAKTKASTAASNIFDAEKLFAELSKKYDHVIVYPLSHELSSNYANLVLLGKPYKNIHVIKSKNVAYFIPLELASFLFKIKAGVSFEKALKSLEEWHESQSIYLIPFSNERLVAGGRLSPKAAALAKLLKIVPVIKFEDGKLEKYAKGRSFNRVVRKTFTEIWKKTPQEERKNLRVALLHADNENNLEFQKEFEEISGCDKVYNFYIPSILAIHTGQKALAFAIIHYDSQVIEYLEPFLSKLD